MTTTDKQRARVSDSAKYLVTALTASNISKRYLLAASLEIKDLPLYQKKHTWLRNKIAELERAHDKAFQNIQKALKLEGIELEFDNDCDTVMEEFDKLVFEPVNNKEKGNMSLPEWQSTLAREMKDCVKMSKQELQKALDVYNETH